MRLFWLRCFSLSWILSQKPEAVKNFCPDLTKNQVTRKSRIADLVTSDLVTSDLVLTVPILFLQDRL